MQPLLKTTYNGWANRATWNANLWLASDEGLYGEVIRDVLPPAKDVADAAVRLATLAGWTWPTGFTPDGLALADVDWAEITHHWLPPEDA